MKFILPIFIAVVPILFSCHNRQTVKPAAISAFDDTISVADDTVIKDLPKWYDPGDRFEIRERKIDQALRLKSLQHGYDSLQIRILIDCGHEKTSSLIVLENKKSQWNAVFYSFTKVYSNFESGGSKALDIENIHTENRTPKSGWKYFSGNLIKTGIIDLQDYTMYKKYSDGTDGNQITVEIATAKKYRLYAYPELRWNTQIKDGPGKFNRALTLIEREFNYKRACDD